MTGEVNCIVTKVLIPFVERNAGPEGAASVCRAAGRSRDWLMADHNWIPLRLADDLIRRGQELVGEPDTERFNRRFWEFGMDWKPREERSYLGTYSMGIGDPRTIFARQHVFQGQIHRWRTFETLEVGRDHARYRSTPLPGFVTPRWHCTLMAVTFERFPTNWGLPRAVVTEPECSARGAPACLFEVRWKNPSLGRHFWIPMAGSAATAMALTLGAFALAMPWPVYALTTVLPVTSGVALGFG